MDSAQDYITLKWGTLKEWRITSEKGRELLQQYSDLGRSMSAIMQHDTPEQKRILCELIDLVPSDIYLDWDDRYVTKDEAKRYVLNYGAKAESK